MTCNVKRESHMRTRLNICKIIIVMFQGIKIWPFSGINFSGGFPDLFLEVLTGINLLLRFLYKLSNKYQVP